MFMQRIRCVKLPSFLFQVVLVAFSRNDRAILRRISRAGGSGVNGRSGRETVSEGADIRSIYVYIYMYMYIFGWSFGFFIFPYIGNNHPN